MKKAAAKAKKPVGPSPAQLAAAKLAAGDSGNVLEELMKLVEKEKAEEAVKLANKKKLAYDVNVYSIVQLVAAYCSNGKIPYNSYILIKTELDKLKYFMVGIGASGNVANLQKSITDAVKSIKATHTATLLSNSDPIDFFAYVGVCIGEAISVAEADGLCVDAENKNAYKLNAFEAKHVMDKVANFYVEGLANKVTEGAQLGSSKLATKVGYSFSKAMPQEKTNQLLDLAHEPTTQKRHGIVAIEQFEADHRECLNNAVLPAGIVCTLSPKRGGFAENKAWMEHKKIVPDSFLRLFFRPCPKSPRHGFVDSRVCTTWEEVEAIYNETIEADPESEVVVMYELEAQASAVATSSMIAVGPGNDGATAGKNSVVYDIKSAEIKKSTRNAAKLGPDNEGYVEAVSDGKFTYLVQLRGGPAVAASATRVCAKTVESIRQIVTAEGDGLSWEARMLELGKSADAESTVIWHPGGSMLSHYAVHALLNGLAISFEASPPKVGETFEGEKPDMNWETEAFARGVVMALLDSKAGRLSDKKDLREAFVFAATGVHSAASLTKGDSAEFLGAACATLMLLSAAACCGESRHNTEVRNLSGIGTDRHKVFVRALSDYMGARPLLRLSLESFAGDTWGSSYGGKAWAICAAMCIDLERVLFDIVRGENKVAEAVQLSHRLLNAVHNGGKLLNKFGNSSILDYAAAGSRSFAIHSAFKWYSVAHGTNKLPQVKISEMRSRIVSAGDFEKGAFAFWSTTAGEFVFSPKKAPKTVYEMSDGKAQVRIVDVDTNKVKIQYCFKINRKVEPGSVESGEPIPDISKYKNLTKDINREVAYPNESGYVSFVTSNKELVDLMSTYAEQVGGLEMNPSMASSSSVLYVKATDVKPLGTIPSHGAIVYFGDKYVKVHP